MAGALYLVDITNEQPPPTLAHDDSRMIIYGAVTSVSRSVSAEGRDVVVATPAPGVKVMSITVTSFDEVAPRPHLEVLDSEFCWSIVDEGTNESSTWVQAKQIQDGCTTFKIALHDSVESIGFGRKYFRTPGYFVWASVDDSYEWDLSDPGFPVATEDFITSGTTDSFTQGKTTWEVEASGGLASASERKDPYCRTDDPSTGLRGPWHCQSRPFAGDYSLTTLDQVYASLPGAYYNLADVNLGEQRDLMLLVAGSLVGLVGAVVFRLLEDLLLDSINRTPAT